MDSSRSDYNARGKKEEKYKGDNDTSEYGRDRYQPRMYRGGPSDSSRGMGGRGGRTSDRSKYEDRGDYRSERKDRYDRDLKYGRDRADKDRRGDRKSFDRDAKIPPRVEDRKLVPKEQPVIKKVEAETPKGEEEKQLTEDEKKQLEEENQRREEEERVKREEEEKKKAAEEAERIKAEELHALTDYINETLERNNIKADARAINLAASENRPDESFFTKLDSSLKKNTAFIRKLRNMTESQKDSLSKEFLGLNLTKYIEEVAGAIIDAKLKMTDVPCAIYICGLLHQRYADFSHSLIDVFNKNLLSKKDEKITNASKYRVDLRFLGELIAYGVFTAKEGLPILANQLSILVNSDRDEHNYLPIITSFCKHCGDDYTGIIPRKFRLLSEKYNMDISKSQLLPPDRQKGCRNLLKDYYASLVKHVTTAHKELKSMERHNRKIMQSKGEISTDKKEAYEAAFAVFQKLSSSATVLADLLDEDFPEFPQEEYTEDGNGVLDIFNPLKDAEFQYDGDKTLFEDEDTRSFYETLPDLRAFIPSILYKDSENTHIKDDLKNADTGLEEEMDQLAVDDIEKELETEQIEETMKEAERQEAGVDGAAEAEEERFTLPEPEEDDTESGTLLRVQFESFLASLPNSVNRDIIDKAAIDFCMTFNTKSNRKKLVKALLSVHRTRYDLLPFYSRLVAILQPCMPELASDLVQALKSDFKWHVRKKDQINIESKIKIVRFIGELVKFKVCPKIEALQCLKMLMFDFRHHNIEMTCALLETCGRFLYRSPDSHYRTKIYLEVMMRKRSAMKLEPRYESMIENAFYYSNPPEVQAVARKERPPMHEYIRKLLYKDLSKVTVEKVLRQMRKLKWDDPEIAFYATKCLTSVWNIRYNSVHCAANLLAGIAPFHEHVAIQVVDGVLEDIRLGMEINHPKYNQRRVSCVKYLGELYNYRMVESSVIFKMLYSLITFGVSFDDKVSILDPPEHLFRIRLVCVILETCGQFFDKGSSKKKLDCFLVYFQRYYWFKKSNPVFDEQHPFPIDIENLMNETIEIVRPKLVQYKSYQEACDAAEKLEVEYKAKIASVLSIIETGDEGQDNGEGFDEEEEDGLSTIVEGDEMDEDLTLSGGVTEGSGTQDSETSMSGADADEHEGEGEDEGSSSDEYDDSDVGDEEVKVVKPKTTTSKEDEDFMAALDQMMNDTIQARTQEVIKVPQLDIALPTQLKNKKKCTGNIIPAWYVSGHSPADKEEEEANSGLKFVLMTRKGNKQQLTDFEIPMTAEFATKFKEREEAERLEKEKMKQMVLNFHERQEEEEYQEVLASLNRTATTNVNRERKVKYHHPKGAPDADLIFGNKKR
ncbi:regulator of nonsense transcripts 2-like isoform X2 [Physella acuta]|uniref:regulator of nonsense transcripts 2-like isoform X2 n=1 Tax=Physella acuta TaxID=109671 RepID=UPI0027DBF244|nr:regulator of nonsense transcripts 2-like isoform X2 [Physella acuta]